MNKREIRNDLRSILERMSRSELLSTYKGFVWTSEHKNFEAMRQAVSECDHLSDSQVIEMILDRDVS